MAFKAGKPTNNADPILVELDKDGDRTAYFDDGSKVVFPEGTTFTHEEVPGKEAQRVRRGDASLVLIRGATKGAVMVAALQCLEG